MIRAVRCARSRRSVQRDPIAHASNPDAHPAHARSGNGPAVPGLRPRSGSSCSAIPISTAGSRSTSTGNFLRSSPRMKNAAATIEPLFRRLDADRDGFLSLSEYRKSFPPTARRAGHEGWPFEGEAAGRPSWRRSPPEAGDHARSGAVFRGEDPARAGDALRQVPREHRREAAGRAPSRQPGGPPLGRRLRPGDRPRPPRREPAHPGDPLPRRRAPDAPQGEAPRRGRRRLRGAGSRWAPPTRGPGRPRRGRPPVDLAKGREFWSFRPPKKSSPPPVKRTDWPRGEIDRFLLAALEARGLAPVADADRTEAPPPA